MSNFAFLKYHDPVFLQLAQAAERAFNPDPNTTLVKLRQLGEAFAKDIASRLGVAFDENTKQVDLLRGIDDTVGLDRTVRDLFHTLRKLGNAAAHEYVSNHNEALQALQIAFRLAAWFHGTMGGEAAKGFIPPAFLKPEDPAEKLRQLELEVQRLKSEQTQAKAQLEQNQQLLEAEQQRAVELEIFGAKQADERQIWEALVLEQEQALQQVTARFESNLADNFTYSTQTPATDPGKLALLRSLSQPSLDLNEAETRIIIDQQLREAGWEADSAHLKFSKGARPQKGKFRAIAEWPTDNGPADYVLFYGTVALAVVEAKKKSVDVSGAIDQAKRYSRGFKAASFHELPGGPWGDFLVPFVFSANGKRFLQQLRTQTGVWFCDLPQRYTHGVGNQDLGLTRMIKIVLPIPPIEEQLEIVRLVESLMEVADRLEARYQTARAQVDQLTPSLLAKAFRGELVPQDPNDEPAEKLLERIRSEKAETHVKSQTKRKKFLASPPLTGGD